MVRRMDLWAWIEDKREALEKDGQDRLADLLYSFPNVALSLEYAKFDAMVPEALALARAHGDPWLEVYFRHWDLQSRVFGRLHGESALRDAVSLVDFSHGPETSKCPQSVCTVQDLAACYGVVDGPGYAPERIEVTRETLARINPDWGCFNCISSEHAGALHDAHGPQTALDFIESQANEHFERGSDEHDDFCQRTRIEMLSELGRNEEALALLDKPIDRNDDPSKALMRKTQRALILARLERFDEARDGLPEFERWKSACEFYGMWSNTAVLLVRAGTMPNDGELGGILRAMCERLDANGSVRTLFEVAARSFELAVERKSAWSARDALRMMERALPRLRRPLGAPEKFAACGKALSQLQLPELKHESPEALLSALGEGELDAETDLPLLEAALARWPDDAALIMNFVRALEAVGAEGEALRVIDERVRVGKVDAPLLHRAGKLLLQSAPERFEAWESSVLEHISDPVLRAVTSYWRGARALEVERRDEAIASFEKVLAVDPEDEGALRWLARSLLKPGVDLTAAKRALELHARLEALDALDASDGWDVCTAATIAGDWARVRTVAKSMRMEPDEGEGPIDEAWARCRISIDTADGTDDFPALRTGPVTARIRSLSYETSERSRFDDEWVFDAQPLNEGPDDEETEGGHRWLYRGVFLRTKSTRRPRVFVGESSALDEAFEKKLQSADLVWTDMSEQQGTIELLSAVPSSIDDEKLAELVAPLSVQAPEE